MILAVRNVKKTEPIRDEIIRETKNDEVKIMQVDMSDLRSVHRFCVEFNERETNLHILIHNAGVLPSDEKTKQGFNMVIGVNYIGPFLMTHLFGSQSCNFSYISYSFHSGCNSLHKSKYGPN